MTESDERRPDTWMPVVYVAGPLSGPDRAANITRATQAALYLMAHGLAPICPHLTALPDSGYPHAEPGMPEYERILRVDESIIARCHGLVRLPGASGGSDREVAWAQRRGVPVFHDLDECVRFFKLDKLNSAHPSHLAQARANAAIKARHPRGGQPQRHARNEMNQVEESA